MGRRRAPPPGLPPRGGLLERARASSSRRPSSTRSARASRTTSASGSRPSARRPSTKSSPRGTASSSGCSGRSCPLLRGGRDDRRDDHDVRRGGEPAARDRHAPGARVLAHGASSRRFCSRRILLAVIGGAVGLAASMLMGFVRFSMVNPSSWSEVVFSFEPTPRVLTTALLFARDGPGASSRVARSLPGRPARAVETSLPRHPRPSRGP